MGGGCAYQFNPPKTFPHGVHVHRAGRRTTADPNMCLSLVMITGGTAHDVLSFDTRTFIAVLLPFLHCPTPKTPIRTLFIGTEPTSRDFQQATLRSQWALAHPRPLHKAPFASSRIDRLDPLHRPHLPLPGALHPQGLRQVKECGLHRLHMPKKRVRSNCRAMNTTSPPPFAKANSS